VLLGLGAFCLVVAAVVFAAVAWGRMGALAQGAVLLGATGLTAAGAAAARRRQLRSTAEAVATVAVALALADVHAARVGLLGDVPTALVWAAGLTVVAAASFAYARLVPLGVARLAGLATGCLPLPILAVHADLPAEAVLGVLLAQAAGLVGWLRATGAGPGWFRAAVAVVAAGQWAVATLGAAGLAALAGLVDDFTTVPLAGYVVLLAASASVAVGTAAAWPGRDELRWLGTGAATVLGIHAVVTAAIPVTSFEQRWLVAGGAAVLVAAGARWWSSPWAEPPAGAASFIGLACTLPAGAAIAGAVFGPLAFLADPWQASLADPARTALVDGLWPGSGLTGAFLALPWALLAVWSGRLDRKLAPWLLAGLAGVTVAVVPLAAAASAGAVLATLLATAVAAAVWAELDPRSAPAARALALGSAILASAWGALSAPGTLTVAAVVTATALAAMASSLGRGDRPGALGAATVAFLGGSVLAVTGPLAAGGTVVLGWWTLAAAAAVVSFAGWAAERSLAPALAPAMANRVDGLSVAAFAVALAALALGGDEDVLSATLSLGVAAFAVHAARPSRRPAVWVATSLAVALVWLRLALADVHLVEAYSLPAALALLAAGWFGGRHHGSWASAGPGLVVGLLPSLLVALPDAGLVRPLALVVAGAGLVLVGVCHRRQAPVAVGAVTMVAVGLDQVSPLVAAAPRYLTFAVIGCVLLAVGATFEQRRRDAAELWDRFDALR